MWVECKSFHVTFCLLRVLRTTTTTIITTNTLCKTASAKQSRVSQWNGERRNCACNHFLQRRIYPWRKGHTDLLWIWRMGRRSAKLHWWVTFLSKSRVYVYHTDLWTRLVSTVLLHRQSKMVVCRAVTPLPMVGQSTSAKKGFCLLALQQWSVSPMVKLQSGHHWMIPIQHLFADVCYCLYFGWNFC